MCYRFRDTNSNFLCWFLFFRSQGADTILESCCLNFQEMLASAAAALRTSPCLFLYTSAQANYTAKYKIKYPYGCSEAAARYFHTNVFLCCSSRALLDQYVFCQQPTASSQQPAASHTCLTYVGQVHVVSPSRRYPIIYYTLERRRGQEEEVVGMFT